MSKIATERTISIKQVLYKDRWVTVDLIDVLFNNGKEIKNFIRLTGKNGGYVMVIPHLKDGRFVLVWQCRPVAGMSIEGVAGGREENESWEEAARREMAEEVGYLPGRLMSVGDCFYPQTDSVNNPCHLFLAFDCIPLQEQSGGDEVQGIQKIILTPQEVRALLRQGRIKDLATVAGILFSLSNHLTSATAQNTEG